MSTNSDADASGLHPSDDDRRLLVNVAYRMLGSHAEAIDAVGEGVARWYAVPQGRRREIDSVRAWLMTTVSRICLDTLRSARVTRETYMGVWLPEPAPAAAHAGSQPQDPLDQITLDESVRMALLVVLESLTPAERVAFILHDVFKYPFNDIGRIVGRTPAACRQLATSARRRLSDDSPARAARDDTHLVGALKAAWEAGDIDALVALLDPNATATTDGGGQVRAAVRPIVGAMNVAKALLGVPRRYPGITFDQVAVNGEPGLAARDPQGDLLALLALSIDNGAISNLWVIRNPDKLGGWNRAGSRSTTDDNRVIVTR